MPNLAAEFFEINDQALPTTGLASVATSGTLTQGDTYLIVGRVMSRTSAASGFSECEVQIGGTTFGRQAGTASGFGAFAGTADGDSDALASNSSLSMLTIYTPSGASEVVDVLADGDSSGAVHGHISIVNITPIASSVDSQLATNTNTVSGAPPTTALETIDTWTLTPTEGAGDYLLLQCFEAVDGGSGVELRVAFEENASEIPGFRVEQDVGGIEETGYLSFRLVTLGAGSSSFEMQMSGEAAAGNSSVDYRRANSVLIPASLFAGDAIQMATGDGETPGVGDTTLADTSVTHGDGVSTPYVYLIGAPHMLNFWTQAHPLIDGTTELGSTAMSVSSLGVGPANDLIVQLMVFGETVSASRTVAYRYSKLGGSGNNEVGNAVSRGPTLDDGIVVIAWRLEFEAGTTVATTLDTVDVDDLSPTLIPIVTQAADLEVVEQTDFSPTIDASVIATPSIDIEDVLDISPTIDTSVAIGSAIQTIEIDDITPGVDIGLVVGGDLATIETLDFAPSISVGDSTLPANLDVFEVVDFPAAIRIGAEFPLVGPTRLTVDTRDEFMIGIDTRDEFTIVVDSR